jgi:DNA-binding NarL/FixJ family response regulator
MKHYRILLAEDHQLVRAGLKLLLGSQPDMRVVAEAGTGEEALQKARQFNPDVVVMDLAMPGMNGIKATEAIKAELPEVRILILTSHDDEAYFRQMYSAQASGYVLKRSAGEELLNAIRKIVRGQSHFDEGLANKTLARQLGASAATNQGQACSLTEREEEVLRGVALGYTNKEVANQLGISVKTVETHKVRICGKFDFRSRADMVQYALRQGWLDQTRSPLQLRAA